MVRNSELVKNQQAIIRETDQHGDVDSVKWKRKDGNGTMKRKINFVCGVAVILHVIDHTA